MKKLYEKKHGEDLYCALILEKGDKVKRYWLDCVISMDSIHKYRAKGVDSFEHVRDEFDGDILEDYAAYASGWKGEKKWYYRSQRNLRR